MMKHRIDIRICLTALAAFIALVWCSAIPFPAHAGTVAETTARPSVKPGTYVVRTVWNNAPLSNVRVEWRRQVDDVSPVLSGTTVRFGTAIFRPPSGSYILTAEWRPDKDFTRPRRPGDRFAWYGANPLLVSSEISESITLMLDEVPPLSPMPPPPPGTGINGRVTHNGAPVAAIGVFAYANPDSAFKGDDFEALARTDDRGEFVLNLPPGRYYLLARLRGDNSVDIGPLHKNDLLGYEPNNPVTVQKGRYTTAAIPAFRLKMVKSRAESSAFPSGAIEGRITDRDGKPVPGVYAALYENQGMGGRSVFRSEPVGADGRFVISVPVPGKYFLGARNGYGYPAPGGWSGRWNGSPDHSIQVKSGESRNDVTIIVDRIPADKD